MMSWDDKTYPALLLGIFMLSAVESQNFTFNNNSASPPVTSTDPTSPFASSVPLTHHVPDTISTAGSSKLTDSPTNTTSGTKQSFDKRVDASIIRSMTPAPELDSGATVVVKMSEGTMTTNSGPAHDHTSTAPPALTTHPGINSPPLPAVSDISETDQPTNQPSSTHVPWNTSDPLSVGPSSTTTPNSTMGLSSFTELNSTTGHISTPMASSGIVPYSTTGPSSTNGPLSTNGSLSSTIVPLSTNGSLSSTSPSSTTGLNSTNESSSTTETLSATSPISTTINFTNSSLGVLIPRMPQERTTKKTTTVTSLQPKQDNVPTGQGILPCSPRNGLVSKCLIAIATLAGVATIFMVCTIILCTKLSSRKHLYHIGHAERGIQMVCISAMLPDGNGPHERPHIPKSNRALLPTTVEDSDEEEGDVLTLNSFLPENYSC